MGSDVSQEQKDIPKTMQLILKKHVRKSESTDLNLQTLLQAKDCDLTLNGSNVFDAQTWEASGDSLWYQITWGDRELAELLCPWVAAFEVLVAHVAPGGWKKEGTCATLTVALEPSVPRVSETQHSNHKLVGAVEGELESGPFAPDPFDPGGQLDLFHPNPHDQWAVVRKQAAAEGDVDLLHAFLVFYQPNQPPRWKGLPYGIRKEPSSTASCSLHMAGFTWGREEEA